MPPEEEQALAFLEAGTGGGGATYIEVVDSVKKGNRFSSSVSVARVVLLMFDHAVVNTAGMRKALKKHGVLLLAAGGGGGAGKDADGGHAVADVKQAAKGTGIVNWLSSSLGCWHSTLRVLMTDCF